MRDEIWAIDQKLVGFRDGSESKQGFYRKGFDDFSLDFK